MDELTLLLKELEYILYEQKREEKEEKEALENYLLLLEVLSIF